MTRTRQYRSWISAIHQNGAIRTLALGMLLAAALGAMTTAQAQLTAYSTASKAPRYQTPQVPRET
jgi:hypothetical protein